MAALPSQREKSLTEKCSWMELKAICQVLKESLHLTGASLGRGRREISIPRLALLCWKSKNHPFPLVKSRRGGTTPGRSLTVSNTQRLTTVAISLGKHYSSPILPVSSGCFLIVFKGHFFSTDSQDDLFTPSFPDSQKDALQEASKGTECDKSPRCRRAIAPQGSDTAVKPAYNAISSTVSLCLAKLFHQLNYVGKGSPVRSFFQPPPPALTIVNLPVMTAT